MGNCNRKFKMADFEERINRISNHQGVGTLLIVNEQGRIITQRHKASSTPTPQNIANHVTDLAMKARSVVRDINPFNEMTFSECVPAERRSSSPLTGTFSSSSSRRPTRRHSDYTEWESKGDAPMPHLK